jgi:hypothetical protein
VQRVVFIASVRANAAGGGDVPRSEFVGTPHLSPLLLWKVDVNDSQPTWPPSDDRPDPDKLHGKQPFTGSNLFWAIVGIVLLLLVLGQLIASST